MCPPLLILPHAAEARATIVRQREQDLRERRKIERVRRQQRFDALRHVKGPAK